MKILNFTLCLIVLLTACSYETTNNTDNFQSNQLIGKYKVNLKPLMEEAMKSEDVDDKWKEFGKEIAEMALASVKVEVVFQTGNKGKINVDGKLINFAEMLRDESIEKYKEFHYKLENDSILFMKGKDEDHFKKWAVIENATTNYEHVRLRVIEKGNATTYLLLDKIGD